MPLSIYVFPSVAFGALLRQGYTQELDVDESETVDRINAVSKTPQCRNPLSDAALAKSE